MNMHYLHILHSLYSASEATFFLLQDMNATSIPSALEISPVLLDSKHLIEIKTAT
jgi:hypothetical protein